MLTEEIEILPLKIMLHLRQIHSQCRRSWYCYADV